MGTYTASFAGLNPTKTYSVKVYVLNSYAPGETPAMDVSLIPQATLANITFNNVLDANHDNEIKIDELVKFMLTAPAADINQDNVFDSKDGVFLLNRITPHN